MYNYLIKSPSYNNNKQQASHLSSMSKVSGMKLGTVIPQVDKASVEQFDNQFLQNQEEYNSAQDGLHNQNTIAHSQYLPMQSKKDKVTEQSKDNEEKRLRKLNKGMDKLSVSILEMKQKYKDLDMDQILFKKRNQKKENQIKQFLSRKKSEKAQLMRKRKKRLERESKSLQQSIFLQQRKEKDKISQKVQENIKKLRENKQQKQNQMKIQKEKDKKVNQMYSKIHQQQKKQPKFHLRKLQQDKKNAMARMQTQKVYLAKRRQNYKPLDIEQIQNHGKKYEELLQQLDQLKRAQKQQKYLRIMEENKKLENFHRGKSYELVLQQRQSINEKKGEALQKYKKMKNYQDYVRQNFIPKTQQKSVQNSQINFDGRHSSLSHRQIRRYKHINGISYGEMVVQTKPTPKTEAQQRKLGVGYLAYMKSLPKRRYDDDPAFNKSQQMIAQQMKEKLKKPNPLAERSGKKSKMVKISDNPTRQQLNMMMKQLKNKDEQLKMKQKVVRIASGNSPSANNKQIGEELIFNIQRKLNLLSQL